MINKKYNIIEFPNGEKELVVSFDDKKLELLEVFVNGELSNFSDWIQSNIEDVLNKNTQTQHISGNICELYIDYQKTRIYNVLTDDDFYCEIDTEELYKLIGEWIEKNLSIKSK